MSNIIIYKSAALLGGGSLDIVRKTVGIGSNKYDRFDFCVSKEKPDRYGDIVCVRGVNYPRSLIGLWNHEHDTPIARWVNTRVEGDELRSRVEFAPTGISPRIDELRKLTEHGVIDSCSIGFIPIRQEPIISNGKKTGVRYLESSLAEISLVSCPANVDAVSLAKSLKISPETIKEVFQMTDSIGARIRRARAVVRKAKAMMAKTTSERTRASLMKAIAILEQEDREPMVASMRLPENRERQRREHAQEVTRRAKDMIEKINARSAREESSGFMGQARAAHAEMMANFSREAAKHADPDLPREAPLFSTEKTWRGQKIPGPTWRGRKV
jgi:HK97 family phage prohead protease